GLDGHAPKKPGPHLGARPHVAELSPRPQRRLLHRVLRRLTVVEHAERKAKGLVDKPPDQLIKGEAIAGFRRAEEVARGLFGHDVTLSTRGRDGNVPSAHSLSLRRGHSCGTDSRNQEDTGGHQRTRRRAKLSTGGHWRTHRNTEGHTTTPVRDREAPGSNPGPPTNF